MQSWLHLILKEITFMIRLEWNELLNTGEQEGWSSQRKHTRRSTGVAEHRTSVHREEGSEAGEWVKEGRDARVLDHKQERAKLSLTA